MVVATLIQSLFHFDGVATIGSAFGGIPQGFPDFNPPQITLARVIDLIGPAFAIAMLGPSNRCFPLWLPTEWPALGMTPIRS